MGVASPCVRCGEPSFITVNGLHYCSAHCPVQLFDFMGQPKPASYFQELLDLNATVERALHSGLENEVRE